MSLKYVDVRNEVAKQAPIDALAEEHALTRNAIKRTKKRLKELPTA
ncbi:MAG: hypothetical protein ACETWM_07675 [Candidatus Lokiarchaeia archaeon]